MPVEVVADEQNHAATPEWIKVDAFSVAASSVSVTAGCSGLSSRDVTVTRVRWCVTFRAWQAISIGIQC